eukprot:m.945243 g.945243  ORF g.945243 m.945243 type:complete len:94 (+) comp23845_c0_seq8:232-513(+)
MGVCSSKEDPNAIAENDGDNDDARSMETSNEDELIALKMVADAEHASFDELEGKNDDDDTIGEEDDDGDGGTAKARPVRYLCEVLRMKTPHTT